MAERLLTAHAEVQLAAPSIVMERLCACFRKFGDMRVVICCRRQCGLPPSRTTDKVLRLGCCENRNFRTIRAHLRRDRNLAREEHLAVAYWRRGFAGDSARRDES